MALSIFEWLFYTGFTVVSLQYAYAPVYDSKQTGSFKSLFAGWYFMLLLLYAEISSKSTFSKEFF